jgi:hypothetical protein
LTVHPVFESFDVASTGELELLFLNLTQAVTSINRGHSSCKHMIQSGPQGRRRDGSVVSQDQLIEFLQKGPRRLIKGPDLRRGIVWRDLRLGRLRGQETGCR